MLITQSPHHPHLCTNLFSPKPHHLRAVFLKNSSITSLALARCQMISSHLHPQPDPLPDTRKLHCGQDPEAPLMSLSFLNNRNLCP